MIAQFTSYIPNIPPTSYVHRSAHIIGNVTLGNNTSIWCNAVVRGDVNAIRIGSGTNIQDNCVLHVEYKLHTLDIGDYVTVGHAAVLHGCRIEDDCLVGIGAIILNGALIGRGSVVAAGTVVPEGAVVPPGSLVMGVPGKVRRTVSPEEQLRLRTNAQHYIELAAQYRQSES